MLDSRRYMAQACAYLCHHCLYRLWWFRWIRWIQRPVCKSLPVYLCLTRQTMSLSRG